MGFIDGDFWKEVDGMKAVAKELVEAIVPRMHDSAFAFIGVEINSFVFGVMNDAQIALFDRDEKNLEQKCKIPQARTSQAGCSSYN